RHADLAISPVGGAGNVCRRLSCHPQQRRHETTRRLSDLHVRRETVSDHHRLAVLVSGNHSPRRRRLPRHLGFLIHRVQSLPSAPPLRLADLLWRSIATILTKSLGSSMVLPKTPARQNDRTLLPRIEAGRRKEAREQGGRKRVSKDV